MPDLLVAYCEAWDTPLRTSKHHYIERLADAGWRVLYVEVPATPVTAVSRPRQFLIGALPRVLAGPRPVRANVWALASLSPLPFHRRPAGVFDRMWLNAVNQRIMLRRLRGTMAALKFDSPVVLSYYPMMLPILADLAPRRTVFHMVDEWQGLPGVPRSMATLTRAMLAQADVTIVTSQRLYDRYRLQARDIRLLRHGTDLAMFAPVAQGLVAPDADIAALPGRRIGYYGALHKLDFALVGRVAARRPHWSFVFIGPVAGPQGIAPPAGLPANVHVREARPRAELPGVLAAIDAFWMPFTVDDLTHSMCPIKLFEALSAGVPVVSTMLDEVAAAGGGAVLLADGPEGHLAALEAAVADKDPDRRAARTRSVAGSDWSALFARFVPLLSGTDGRPER